MKRFTTVAIAASAVAALAHSTHASAQTQSRYPTTQPAPSPQAVPSDEPSTPSPPSDPAGPTTLQSGERPNAAAAPPATRLAALVPAGMSTREACDGFDSVKECAAALHAAQNLDIPFPQLKSKLNGGLPLSLTIHDLKPEVDAASEARKAEAQASSDLRVRPQG